MIRFRYLSRIAALLVLCLAICLAWLMVVSPILNVFAGLSRQKDELNVELNFAHDRINARQGILNDLTKIRIHNEQINLFRSEATDTLAIADFQNNLQQIIIQNNGQLMSVSRLPVEDRDGFEMLSLQITMTLPAPSLSAFLKDLETSQSAMLVEAAAVTAQDNSGGTISETQNLTIQMTIATDWRLP